MSLIDQQTRIKLVDAILYSGIDVLDERPNFLQSVNARFVQGLTRSNKPRIQIMGDIGKMSEVERLADGEMPLLVYLQNVVASLSGMNEEKIVREIIDGIIQKTSGASRPDPAQMPEIKEKIIHRDDTVTFAFMQAGLQAAAAVVKLQVPAIENGQPRKQANGTIIRFFGTGWLLSGDLVITNHHVVNARMDNEPPASDADLLLQAKGTTVIFDYDAENIEGSEQSVQELLAWNAGLDYAVLRIAPGNRKALQYIRKVMETGSDSIAVNIIQHPGGKSKRYAIRNNLVSASTSTELRYFTDTEAGSSGSPVFNDQWQVVALHRAAIYVTGMQFQGKDTAYVNIGTHIAVILEDIKTRYSQVFEVPDG